MGYSSQQRMELVREWKRSGLKAAEFAKRHGYPVHPPRSCQLRSMRRYSLRERDRDINSMQTARSQ